MKVKIETEDWHECTPCEYKDTKKEQKGKYICFDVIKVDQKKEKRYNCSKKDTQEPYIEDLYKTKNRRNVTDMSIYVPKRILWVRTSI